MSTRPHLFPEPQDLGRDHTAALQDDYGRAFAGSQLVVVPTRRRPTFPEPLAVSDHSLAYTDKRRTDGLPRLLAEENSCESSHRNFPGDEAQLWRVPKPRGA